MSFKIEYLIKTNGFQLIPKKYFNAISKEDDGRRAETLLN